MRSRILVVSVAAATALTSIAVPSAIAAPAGHGNGVAGARAGASPERRHAPALSTRAQVALRSSTAQAPSAPRVPHLDPKLQQAAAASSPSTVAVTVGGDQAAIAKAVQAVHGRVVASAGGVASAIVPRTALATLAGHAGVTSVTKPVRAFIQDSEGVAKSNAGPATTLGTWQNAGDNGTGVKIAIVDGGFKMLSAEATAGRLPSGLTITGNHCANSNTTEHGTAVAEIVHQMAPAAQLVLYCVDDNVGFKLAGDEIAGQTAPKVSVVNSSLGFPGDSRGDGSGYATTPTGLASGDYTAAGTVKAARKAGILWVQSAGNNAADHWSGTLSAPDSDGLVEFDGATNATDSVLVYPQQSASFVVQWDQWPVSSAALTLGAIGYRCNDADCTTGNQTQVSGTPIYASQSAGATPVLQIDVTNPNAPAADPATDLTGYEVWGIALLADATPPRVRYDMSYWGGVSDNYIADIDAAHSARAAAGSITEPASSPYALAAGAAYQGDSTLEYFSSQGPTIDGRVKPDITGWDGVTTSSNFDEFYTGSGYTFYGTSAAAPHVAGAAALVKGAHSTWDAAQIQNFLEQRASSGVPKNPPNNHLGHGLLTLGSPTGALPTTSRYVGRDTPLRVLDTRTTVGGHLGMLGNGGTATIALSGQVSSTATAVAINLTGTGETGSGYLSAYATTFGNSSNLNLTTSDSTAAVYAIVPLSAAKKITIRNTGSNVNVVVDLLGYYDSSVTVGGYVPQVTNRILDTRSTLGGNPGRLTNGKTITVSVPSSLASATALMVNVTAVNPQASGYLRVTADGSAGSSTLNYLTGRTRANMSTVKLSTTTSGTFKIYNYGGPADVLIDVVGSFVSTGTAAGYVPLPSPVRTVDTRLGNGGRRTPLGTAESTSVVATGIFDVPYPATAIMGNLTPVPTSSSYLEVYTGSRPVGSNTNFTAGRIVPNAIVSSVTTNAQPAAETVHVFNLAASTHFIVDLFGYFI